jgi:hypothetical protein
MIRIGDERHGRLIAMAACVGYDPETDKTFSRVDSDGCFLGGFVLTDYTGSTMTDHMAGVGNWCSPQLMWVIFDYQFEQCSLKKVMCTVSSHRRNVVDLVTRAGFRHEYSIEDGVPEGQMHLFSMSKDQCKWLRLRDRYLKVNGIHRGEHVHVHA